MISIWTLSNPNASLSSKDLAELFDCKAQALGRMVYSGCIPRPTAHRGDRGTGVAWVASDTQVVKRALWRVGALNKCYFW